MSRHYDEQDRWIKSIAGKMHNVFDRAIDGYMNHDKMLEIASTYIYDDKHYGKLTRYNKAYLRGLWQARMRDLYRNHVEWRVCYNGEYMVGKNVPDGEWDKVGTGKHFWIGTDKEF